MTSGYLKVKVRVCSDEVLGVWALAASADQTNTCFSDPLLAALEGEGLEMGWGWRWGVATWLRETGVNVGVVQGLMEGGAEKGETPPLPLPIQNADVLPVK